MILSKENIKELNVDHLVNSYIKAGRVDEILIVVPTNRKLRNYKKEIISDSPGQSVSKINIETITTLSTKLLEANKTFLPLSEAAASVLIKQCAEKIDFKYLINFKDKIPFGTLDRIKNVISEYKKHAFSPEQLKAEAKELTKSERLKAEDIAEIYKNFLSLCEELNIYDVGDIYAELNKLENDEFLKCYNENYKEVKTTIVNGFDEFTKHEVEIINRLSNIKNVSLHLNFDYYNFNPAIFSHLDKCYKHFEIKNFKRVTDTSETAVDLFKVKIRENLFLDKTLTPDKNFKDKITRITTTSREKEIEVIAKEVKKLIVEEGVEPHKICVAFNVINQYSPIVRDLFSVYEIPVNLTDRLSIAKSYPVIAIINLLEIAENDFYYKNIFRALSSGFISLPEINLSNLFNTAVKLKIVVGKNNWQNRIKDKVERLKHFSTDENFDERELAKLDKALTDIKFLENILKPFYKSLTIDEFLTNLKKLIDDVKLPYLVLEEADEKEEENIKAVAAFFQTMYEIFELLKTEEGNKEKYKLGYFLDQIRTFSSWARFNVKEKSNYGVQVTTVNEIRGLNFDYLFLGGLCDGDFPTRFSPEIFFSGSFARAEHIHQTEERYHFYQSLCSWNKKLYLTNPLYSGNKELVESNFLRDFEKLFEVDLLTEADYVNTIYSKNELLEETGRILRLKEENDFVKSFLENQFDEISHSVDVDVNRVEQLENPDEYSGSVFVDEKADHNKIETALNEYTDKQYSVSELESFAKCPYKYFAERILKLEVLEEPEDEIEAIEIGSLLHAILFEFYSELRRKKIQLKNCDDKTFESAEQILFEIAEEKISEVYFDSVFSFYEKEKIFGIGGNKNESILYKFLIEERMSSDNHLPAFFETAFGKIRSSASDEELSTQEPIEVEGIKFRGLIDRIDFENGDSTVNIIDYKLSGKKPTKDELWDGISLQLPFYLYAAGKLLTAKLGKDIDLELMYIYSLKYKKGEFGKNKISITTKRKDVDYKALNEELIESTIYHIKNYVESIKEGKFNLSPHNDREKLVCGYCQFKSICRIQELPQ